MSSSVLYFDKSNPRIGLTVRKPRLGPEIELVHAFVRRFVQDAFSPTTHLAVFYEPLLISGFPDIVIAEYDMNTYRTWTGSRSTFTLQEIQLLHYLHLMQVVDEGHIQAQLRVSARRMQKLLQNLVQGNCIEHTPHGWKAHPLAQNFSIHRLIAIEAKMQARQQVVNQAQHNQWFASETYVLLPGEQPSSLVIERSEHYRVGVYSYHDGHVHEWKRAPVGQLPLSYSSWLFNEWIGRALFSSRGICDGTTSTFD